MCHFADNVVQCLVTVSLLLSLLPAVPASAAPLASPGYQIETPTVTPEPATPETPPPATTEAEEPQAPTDTATTPPETPTSLPPAAETATPAPTDTPAPIFTPEPEATLRVSTNETAGRQIYLPLVLKAAVPQAGFSSPWPAGPALLSGPLSTARRTPPPWSGISGMAPPRRS